MFEGIASADPNVEFVIKVSYVEIYMERIRDLLDPTHVRDNLQVGCRDARALLLPPPLLLTRDAARAQIREDPQTGVYVAGVTEEFVTDYEELLGAMSRGAESRATAATGMNCLLYTSPSPRDQRGSRMPSSA